MKRNRVAWIAVVLALVFLGAHVSAQDSAPQRTRMFIGPCLGVGGVIMPGDAFNSNMQSIYAADKVYYPVFSEMGAQASQLIRLGESRTSLASHEIFLLSGLDQGMPMPTLDILFGYAAARGLEVGVGPHFAVMAPNGSVKLSASVMYAVGWTLSLDNVQVPIKLAFIPLPSYANPQISLVTAFLFEALD